MDSNKKAEVNGLCIAGLIFGIMSVLTCWTVMLIPFNAGMAVTLSCLSRGSSKMNGLSVLSIVLAGISILIGLLVIIFVIVFAVGAVMQMWKEIAYELYDGTGLDQFALFFTIKAMH